MDLQYIIDKDFKGRNFSESPLEKGEYESCTFTACIFIAANCTEIIFSECKFEDCDFSNANITGATFRDIDFKNCKLLGLRFDSCNPFLLSFGFEACILNFSSFYKLKLKQTHFLDCKLEQVDFMETNLQGAIFENCDLRGALFKNTNLAGANLQTASNFSMDPESNYLKKARFSMENCRGLLDKYQIIIE